MSCGAVSAMRFISGVVDVAGGPSSCFVVERLLLGSPLSQLFSDAAAAVSFGAFFPFDTGGMYTCFSPC
jgi:hypothetical protein